MRELAFYLVSGQRAWQAKHINHLYASPLFLSLSLARQHARCMLENLQKSTQACDLRSPEADVPDDSSHQDDRPT